MVNTTSSKKTITSEKIVHVTLFDDGSTIEYDSPQLPYSTTYRMDLMQDEIKACWKISPVLGTSGGQINIRSGVCCGDMFLEIDLENTTKAMFAQEGERTVCAEKIIFEQSEIIPTVTKLLEHVFAPKSESVVSVESDDQFALRKMTRAEILELRPSDDQYYIVLTRLYEPEPKLIFEGMSQLYIQRVVLKKTVDRLSIVSPANIEWAEYARDSIEEDGTCVVETYQMEIFVPKEK